jgi:uncharacterized protein (TIGR04255 family)
MNSTFRIDTNEHFPHLSKAPIIEAVIDLHTQNTLNWVEETAIHFVKEKIKEYAIVQSQSQFLQEVTFAPNKEAQQKMHPATWLGVRAQTPDRYYIVQFNKTGFVLSRLKPYENWGQFTKEAFRLWDIYKSVLKPASIERIGIRFINQIMQPIQGLKIQNYLANVPSEFLGINSVLSGFLYNEIIDLPGSPYSLRLIRTVQPVRSAEINQAGIIIDIDVFTKPGFSCDPETDVGRILTEMQWIKNKAFFTNITKDCLKELE